MKLKENSPDMKQKVGSWISNIVLDIADKPELTSCKVIMDDHGLLVTIYVPKGELGKLVGAKGVTAESIRRLAHLYGRKYKVHAAVKFEEA